MLHSCKRYHVILWKVHESIIAIKYIPLGRDVDESTFE